ncbi:UTP--glucose-1-phosphate uridylyltransferase [Caerostris extrusa]|uniref:UTP--glucose-1-phosphate uridylyltransferase n=1 Tax=Caerostris extrusa TaxID=172846 RepID=A0AAV4N4Y6_CAEEX|nr:UTP--glucose-1-phosphate uridylyltransferase [Caerostris extrusa]
MEYNNFSYPGRDDIQSMLNQLVVVKLNGGLGTTMKCDGPKSLIPVRSDLSFLDLTVQQIENLNTEYDVNIPLVLMNSFNTNESTDHMLKNTVVLKLKFIHFCKTNILILMHLNLILFRILSKKVNLFWYPPGHGNFYESFNKCGLLRKFLKDGKKYCFVSNIDNLGATVDFAILNFLMNPPTGQHAAFLMEVTNKTPADIKGGTVVLHKEKK